jgi:hypothetical protein
MIPWLNLSETTSTPGSSSITRNTAGAWFRSLAAGQALSLNLFAYHGLLHGLTLGRRAAASETTDASTCIELHLSRVGLDSKNMASNGFAEGIATGSFVADAMGRFCTQGPPEAPLPIDSHVVDPPNDHEVENGRERPGTVLGAIHAALLKLRSLRADVYSRRAWVMSCIDVTSASFRAWTARRRLNVLRRDSVRSKRADPCPHPTSNESENPRAWRKCGWLPPVKRRRSTDS